MPTDLAHRFLRVVEAAAIAAARTTGQGERDRSDQVATEAMRMVMGAVPMRGRIVIGEGERDEAPMLYIGEEVGHWQQNSPRVDIAVDPLEGTNLCATGSPGAMAVLAASEEGGLLHAPDCYMQKLIVGPRCRGRIDLDAPVAENLKGIADALSRDVGDVTVVVLQRERHTKLIADIRAAGARIHLITDGDLSPAISACVTGTAVHAVMGIGGAPEGVLAATAVRCLGGEMQGRLVEFKEGDRRRAEKMGVTDFDQLHTADTLAPGKRLIFAATGVTDCDLMKGVALFGTGVRTQSIVMGLEQPRRVRFVDTIHLNEDEQDIEIRL
jgi:fructose-1,6-bisphosphatase class II